MDEFMELSENLNINYLYAGNLVYGFSQQQRTRDTIQHHYQDLGTLHLARVTILSGLLGNSCVPTWLKFEIVNNLPRLCYLEDPEFYQLN